MFTKTPDGVPRCLLLNRSWEERPLGVHAPRGMFEGTLFDVEVMEDERRFVVLDALVLNGSSLIPWSFELRLAAAAGQVCAFDDDWQLSMKKWHPVRQARAVWAAACTTPEHPPDGLVFMPVDTPPTVGAMDTLLKWKPEHTVDLQVAEDGALYAAAGVRVTSLQLAKPCAAGLWEGVVSPALHFLPRFRRTDKPRPNNEYTVLRTLEAAHDGLLIDELVAAVEAE